MKIYAVLIGLFLSTLNQLAAQNQIDSLKSVLTKQSGSARVETLLNISDQFLFQNHDSVTYYLTQAYEMIDPEANDELSLKVQLTYASHLTESRKLAEAQMIITKTINNCIAANDSVGLASAYNTQANIYFYDSKQEKALPYYRQSLEIEERLGNPLEYAKSLGNFGILLGRMGRNEDERDAYFKALEIFEAEGQKSSALRILLNLCSTYSYENRSFYSLDSSIYFGKKARQYAEDIQFAFGVAKINSILCSPLIRKGYEDLVYLQEGLEASQSARKFFESNPNFVVEYQTSYLNEGYAYEALGQEEKAIKIAQDLLKKDFFAENEVYRLLYRSYKKKGDFNNALAAHERLFSLVDSLRDLNVVTQINEIQTKYESEKKDQEIESLSQKAQIQELELRQRNSLLIGGAIVFILIIVVIVVWSRIRSIRREQFVTGLEQRMLRLQMNPHFIFNALASIQNYILKSDTKESVTYLAKFGKLMRQILEHSREEFISITEEADMLRNYLEIQQLRFKNRFDFVIEIDPEIDLESAQIPPLFAQPFVENAIEHGLSDQEAGGMIKVRFKLNGTNIQLEVEDNGKGIPASTESVKEHKSLATIISRERLGILSKQFGSTFTLKVEDSTESGGARATLVLPMMQ